jgi:uroporphyrinogen-III synthase
MADAALAGRRILVTRPAAQAEGLARRIREAGGEPVCVPAIEIRDIEDLASAHAVADALEAFGLAIFVSGNAVRRGLAILRARRGARSWPAGLRVATVGQGSREALLAEGFAEVLAPEGRSDSEALLALPALAPARVRGVRVAIFRGDGGRALLGEALERRGARVSYAACYRRVRPEGGALRAAWRAGLDAVTVTSAEGLANLLDMLGGEAARLAALPVFVPHARVAAEAARRGLANARVAGPRDEEMAAAVVAYFGAPG